MSLKKALTNFCTVENGTVSYSFGQNWAGSCSFVQFRAVWFRFVQFGVVSHGLVSFRRVWFALVPAGAGAGVGRLSLGRLIAAGEIEQLPQGGGLLACRLAAGGYGRGEDSFGFC